MTGTFGRERAPERACLKCSEWPAADRRLWEAELRPGDVLEPGGSRSGYARISNRKVELGYGRFLTHLSMLPDVNWSEPPGQRITEERVLSYLYRLKELGNGTATILARLQELDEAALVMDPSGNWSWIRRIASRVRAAHVPVRDKRGKLIGSEELVDLGLSLMRDADQQATSNSSAVAFRDGLLIALLALRPAMRRRNIAALELEQHLRRVGDSWIIVFDESETKTKVPLELPWPDKLVAALEIWLDRWRPVLVGGIGRWHRSAGNAVWVSRHGSPMTEQAIYDRIVGRTRERFGRPINPHFFRDCAVTTLAYADPKRVGIGSALLGHRNFATTQRYYLQAQMVEASRRMQEDLLKVRHRRLKE